MASGKWADSDRRSRLPGDWETRRAAVKQRAGGRCEASLPRTGARCPHPGTDCDHIEAGDNHDLSNLQWLCRHHHKQKTSGEAIAGRAAKKANPRRSRRTEQHPGLIKRSQEEA
ncbi:HNH endonuclease signature motif containing protein [Nocardioides sp.]|uniref:HNH endonuclease n=1 Tax=Nocardioides sp. TaxID=35761 RepID=UPI00260B3E6C|nr:HNH endonuclease signature motif containing protein [Nocardioides sp.]